jgi:CRP-like cAMP-binding protein
VDELVRGFKESEKLRALQVTFLPQEIVFFEGDTTSEMYILLSGKVEILKDGKRIAVVEYRVVRLSGPCLPASSL